MEYVYYLLTLIVVGGSAWTLWRHERVVWTRESICTPEYIFSMVVTMAGFIGGILAIDTKLPIEQSVSLGLVIATVLVGVLTGINAAIEKFKARSFSNRPK